MTPICLTVLLKGSTSRKRGRPIASLRLINNDVYKPSGLSIGADGHVERIQLPVSRQTFEVDASTPYLVVEWADGSTRTASALEWQVEESQDGAGGGWATLTGCSPELGLTVRLGPGDDQEYLLNWQVEVENRREVALDRVTWELALLNVPSNWFCTLPWCGGWAIQLQDWEPGAEVTMRYPVLCSLQWIELFGGDEGLTVGTRDPEPWLKDFSLARTGQGLTISICHHHLLLQRGDSVRLPTIVAGAHRGDWQTAAAGYASWLGSVVTDPARAPEWLQSDPSWAWVQGKQQNAAEPTHSYSDLPACSQAFSVHGFPTIQVAGWLENGHDTCYPDYVAGDSLGGDEALRAAVAEIHAAQRHLALYTNGRLFDPLSQTATAHPDWPQGAVRTAPGSRFQDTLAQECTGIETDVGLPDWDPGDQLVKEKYGNVVFAVMCPGSTDWQDIFAHRLASVASRYQIDGLYIDQVLGAVALPCFAQTHAHNKPYQAWQGYHALMAKVRKRVKDARSQAYLATEGFSDILSQYFDLVQSHNDWSGPCPKGSFPFPEMTRHAVPWLMQAAGPIRENDFSGLRLAHLVASGFDLACHQVAENSTFSQQLQLVTGWRRRFGRDLYQGRPIPAWIDSFPARRIIALATDRSVYCCISTWGEAELKDEMQIQLELPSHLADVTELNWESTSAQGRVTIEGQAGNRTRFTLPAADMLMVWGRSR